MAGWMQEIWLWGSRAWSKFRGPVTGVKLVVSLLGLLGLGFMFPTGIQVSLASLLVLWWLYCLGATRSADRLRTVERLQLLWARNSEGTRNLAYCPVCPGPLLLDEQFPPGPAGEGGCAGVDNPPMVVLTCHGGSRPHSYERPAPAYLSIVHDLSVTEHLAQKAD